MQASAPKLTITLGGKVGKEEIKGAGDVHFSLAEGEWEQLRRRFPMD